MPLKKLWNSILGTSAPQAAVQTNPPNPSSAPKQPTRRESNEERRLAKPTVPKRGLLDRLGRGSHASICRLVKRSGATSVLEIGVGDGQRALAVAASLVEANPDSKVCYAAIDKFEMGDGPITLKDFNQQLRSQNVKPSLVPMDITAGLARVSSTLGMIDLVLIAEPTETIETNVLIASLRRLTTERSSVYQLVDENWVKIDISGKAQGARAA